MNPLGITITVDPTMPPDQLAIRCGHQEVRIINVGQEATKPAQEPTATPHMESFIREAAQAKRDAQEPTTVMLGAPVGIWPGAEVPPEVPVFNLGWDAQQAIITTPQGPQAIVGTPAAIQTIKDALQRDPDSIQAKLDLQWEAAKALEVERDAAMRRASTAERRVEELSTICQRIRHITAKPSFELDDLPEWVQKTLDAGRKAAIEADDRATRAEDALKAREAAATPEPAAPPREPTYESAINQIATLCGMVPGSRLTDLVRAVCKLKAKLEYADGAIGQWTNRATHWQEQAERVSAIAASAEAQLKALEDGDYADMIQRAIQAEHRRIVALFEKGVAIDKPHVTHIPSLARLDFQTQVFTIDPDFLQQVLGQQP